MTGGGVVRERAERLGLFLSLFFLFAWSSCVLIPESSNRTLRMKFTGTSSDTLSPFPTIRIAFGEPLKQSRVGLTMTPAFPCAYYIWLNAHRDTITVEVNGLLEGNTRYVIRLAEPITGISGATLYPLDDSLVFFTHPRESAQNRTLSTADSLYGRLFGLLERAGDTAFFFVPETGDTAIFYACSHGGGACRLLVDDTAGGRLVSQPLFVGGCDTIGARAPLLLRLYADPMQAGVRFEIGVVNPKSKN